MIKAGTVRELAQFKKAIDRGVYNVALRIVTTLDELYGADRDVDNGDGGFVLIAETVQDITDIAQRYVRIDESRHEAVDVVKCGNKTYLNSLFLSNNEFGINIFMPIEFAPQALLRAFPQKAR